MLNTEFDKQDKIDRMMFLVKMQSSGNHFTIGGKDVYFSVGGALCSKGKMIKYDFNRLICDKCIELKETVIS